MPSPLQIAARVAISALFGFAGLLIGGFLALVLANLGSSTLHGLDGPALLLLLLGIFAGGVGGAIAGYFVAKRLTARRPPSGPDRSN